MTLAGSPARLPASGAYLVAFVLPRPVCFAAGRLPAARYRSGVYLYAGRARRSLPARLVRQVGPVVVCRWHVDYLKANGARALAAWVFPSADDECRLALRLAATPGVRVPAPGFGASDCCAGCPAHLLLLPRDVAWPALVDAVAAALGGQRVM